MDSPYVSASPKHDSRTRNVEATFKKLTMKQACHKQEVDWHPCPRIPCSIGEAAENSQQLVKSALDSWVAGLMPFADRTPHAGKARVQNKIVTRHQLPVPGTLQSAWTPGCQPSSRWCKSSGPMISKGGLELPPKKIPQAGFNLIFNSMIQLRQHEIHVSVSLYFATCSASMVT